jgi:hypothetical protein
LNGGVGEVAEGTLPPPRVFGKKSPQVAENKERELEKERQEIPRGGKLLRINVLPQMSVGTRIRNEVGNPRPGGNADVYQTQEGVGKAICKTMKTKEPQKAN